MDIVEFTQNREREVVALWNDTLTFDQITLERFHNQILWDDNFDARLSLVAIVNDEVIGFIVATKRKFPYFERGLEPARGWINLIFVREDNRRSGIGSILLSEVEQRLAEQGATQLTVAAYSPGYVFRGIDAAAYPAAPVFFEAHGYVCTDECYPMSRDLFGFSRSSSVIKKLDQLQEAGYKIISFSNDRSLELLDFARDEFGGGWKRNCLMSMREGKACDRILLVIDAQNTIVGFCCRAIDGNPMRFGPIGIAAAHRDEGLGGVLLEQAMLEMERRGIHHLFFLSTDASGRRFYERHGLKVTRTLIGYEKNLSASVSV